MNLATRVEILGDWIVRNTPSDNGLIVPVSGGSDSALCFWLCSRVMKERTLGVYIGKDLRQKEWFESIGVIHYGSIQEDSDNPEVDRWAYFLRVALKEHRVLTGSRNLTEHTLGTYSTASRVASFLPLAGLWKHEVMELCGYVGIPDEIIQSSLRADPACGRPEKMSAIPFEVLDDFLQVKLGLRDDMPSFAAGQEEYLESMYTGNLYKRELPLTGPSFTT